MIDLGPGNHARELQQALVAAGLDPVVGDGVEDALAGADVDRDAPQLASKLDEARREFADLQCAAATKDAQAAVAIAAARQAAGLPVPELPRAWSYILLCADRDNDVDTAMVAAQRLRALGATDVDPKVLARYPDVDTLANRDMLEVEIRAVDGAAIWIDHQPAGTAPLKVSLPAGAHVMAAALGPRRGVVTGTVVKTQPVIEIPMVDQSGTYSALAARVRSWHGQLPAPEELGTVLAQIHARVAIVRHGEAIEAWGRIGLAEKPHVLSGDDGKGTLAEASRIAALIADRVAGWNDHAPDPDQPLLVESPAERASFNRRGAATKAEEPTPWWIYTILGGALAASAAVIYVHSTQQDTQHVELHYP